MRDAKMCRIASPLAQNIVNEIFDNACEAKFVRPTAVRHRKALPGVGERSVF